LSQDVDGWEKDERGERREGACLAENVADDSLEFAK